MLDLTKGALLILSICTFVFCLCGCTEEKNERTKTKIDPKTSDSNPAKSTPDSNETEIATFALGCFWGPDAIFGALPGVIQTQVGYAGGSTKNPTYYNLADHAETIQIEYDPAKMTYESLLDIFWKSHNPASLPYNRQYMSIIFYHTDEQKRLAVQTKAQQEKEKSKVYTEVLPFVEFYTAEGYHQKHHLRQHPELVETLREIYPSDDELMSSTIAARLNGYVAGYSAFKTLEEEIETSDLPPKTTQGIIELLKTMGE